MVSSVSEVIFSSANSVCKHSYVLLFSARIRLTLFEKAIAVRELAHDGIASKRSITYTILGLFKKRQPTNCFFMSIALSWIVS